ncbi:Fungal transcriptional regulatory protein [Cordyceps javanica]|uniref:Fungal transcriptional regulatory protein n=1 Tax=Cordyceps javanica TaxID=43265 RepID=A0A545VW02_9HYPO|nr:Fungal transcriptional regulatory protein [Cordyceps javanica]TQW05864.1 Fungal transcriptional regulatory protein [Cordyceps javanica]
MRQTLRRSCSACARAKSRCDLRKPHCSRCAARNIRCVYANEPLSTSPSPHHQQLSGFGAVDPFETYPQVRLGKEHVQRLIHSFLHKIAFQYYPLDLNPQSNPFLVSWWPLALGDPVLFHVSLQTACLDEEFFGRKGFQTSEQLMSDSVVLLRRKVQDVSLAMQDTTINSVITLATIEYGKGNIATAQMHVAGAKRLINMRGGLQAVMQTSPLTARMVSWVSMLISGSPQFDTQDDDGNGDGISPIPEWSLARSIEPTVFPKADIEPEIRNVFARIHGIFRRTGSVPLPPLRLHDLTCFVVHRLLSPPVSEAPSSTLSDCVRCGILLYMLILQGPIYYTHAAILCKTAARLVVQLCNSANTQAAGPLELWLVAIGLVASHGTLSYGALQEKTRSLSALLGLQSWKDARALVKSVLWLEAPRTDADRTVEYK